MTAELTIPLTRRSPKEVLAYLEGNIGAYEMLLKIWPVKKDEIKSFMAASKAMKESWSEYRDNDK